MPAPAAGEEEQKEEPCRLVVLVGAQLERATGGALKAVRHRVVVTEENDNNTAGSGTPPRRLSLVFRLRARHAAVLDPLKLAPKYVCVCVCVLSFCVWPLTEPNHRLSTRSHLNL